MSISYLETAQAYATSGLAFEARLEGVRPGLLMHSADYMQWHARQVEEHAAGGRRGKFIPTPDAEAEAAAYRREDGTLYLPTKNLLRSIVEAGKAFTVPGRRTTFFKAAAAGVTVPVTVADGFTLLDPKTDEPLTEYVLDTQRVTIRGNGIMRSRGRVDDWAVECSFILDPDAVPPNVFAQLVGYAGGRVGLCDNRPERGGQNGRFVPTKLETE
jgi:hypothetical protein